MKKVKVILEAGKDGYGIYFPEIPNVYGFGDTVELAKIDAVQVLNYYRDILIKTGKALPQILQGEYELDFEFDVEALLKYIDGTVTKTALAKASGINPTQLSHYSSGLKRPRKAQREKIISGLHRIAKDLLSVS